MISLFSLLRTIGGIAFIALLATFIGYLLARFLAWPRRWNQIRWVLEPFLWFLFYNTTVFSTITFTAA